MLVDSSFFQAVDDLYGKSVIL